MPEAEKNGNSDSSNTLVIGAVAVTGFAMVAITIWVICLAFRNDGAGNFASIATLVLVGLAAFIGIMNMLSLTAHWMKITDLKQPFGLPEGTVRAILTIAFIVLVGVLTSFMLSNGQRMAISKDSVVLAKGIPLPSATVLEQKFTAEGVVAVTKDVLTELQKVEAEIKTRKDKEDAKKAAGDTTPADPKEKIVLPDTYTVSLHPRVDYRASDEIAKQILTILSTILAAMIGFYFGAKPGESGSAPKTDDRATLLADFNAAKTRPPTLTTVSGKIGEIAKPEDRTAFQQELDAIGAKVKAADDALANPVATIESVRTSVSAAKAALGTLADLNGRVAKAPK